MRNDCDPFKREKLDKKQITPFVKSVEDKIQFLEQEYFKNEMLEVKAHNTFDELISRFNKHQLKKVTFLFNIHFKTFNV